VTGEIIPSMRRDLLRLGVRAGDLLIVHSSFRSLGLAYRTPMDVICTLADVVGTDGTIMMPTFTYCYSGIWNVTPYDPDSTPPLFMGIIADSLRYYDGSLRSGSPTYSVAALGKDAKLLTENRENACGLGPGSSYETAYQLGAKILLIGVGNDRNSMIHYAEAASGLPYNDVPYREFWGKTALAERDGAVVEVPVVDYPGCSVNFRVVDKVLERKGLLKRGRVCRADCMLMDARSIVDAIAELLRENPGWLFCESIACEPCHRRRERLRKHGLIR
jgi:aminoglycoside 3-N-acetyltransferase